MIILREKPAFDEFPVVENPITGHVSNVVTLCLNLTLRILHEHTWLKDVWFREVVKVWGVVDAFDFNGDGCWPLPVEATEKDQRRSPTNIYICRYHCTITGLSK